MQFIECPICGGLFRMINGYKVSTFIYGEFKQLRVCPECYYKYFVKKSISANIEFRGE